MDRPIITDKTPEGTQCKDCAHMLVNQAKDLCECTWGDRTRKTSPKAEACCFFRPLGKATESEGLEALSEW